MFFLKLKNQFYFYIRCSDLKAINPKMEIMEIDDVKERDISKKIHENRLEKRTRKQFVIIRNYA